LDIKSINKLKPIAKTYDRKFKKEKIEILPPKLNNGYQFRLLTNSSMYYLNSQVPERFFNKENYIFISEEDANKYGFKDKQEVLCKNEFGQVITKLKISDKVSQGVLMLYKNRGLIKGSPNMLTTNISTDSNNSYSYYDCFVNLECI
jgi:anaerobic selenocysteine-containing dehydrogenase